jgi:peptide/nickel transport system ATP-binding protein
MPLLDVQKLSVAYRTEAGPFLAVDEVSLTIEPGEVLALVGESGCGKSATSLAIMQLLPSAGSVGAGSIHFEGQDLLTLPEKAMQGIRGRRIGMIFQEPMTSLNPVMTVGNQIAESYRAHTGASARAARARSLELMRQVGIPSAETRMDEFPYQYSGGMRQRIMIAIALAANPSLLIADEPTTALDVTVQAQILDLLTRLRETLKIAVLLITHDLAVVAQNAHRVAVMYAGRVVEQAPVAAIFNTPRHPYTRGLLGSLPRFWQAGARLPGIEGTVPQAGSPRQGCLFYDRCPERLERCRLTQPPETSAAPDHTVACHLYPEAP